MNYLTIGQINIPVAWLAFFVAILYSDFRSRRADVFTSKTIEQLIFLYIIIWKVSYILFSWADFLIAPLSLLYFDGGGKGHILAIGVLAITLYKKKNALDWQMLWQYWVRFTAVFQIISYSFQHQWLIAALWLIVLVMVERQYKQWLLFAQWLLLLWLGGFGDSFTQMHFFVLLTLLLKTRQAQHFAVIGIVSLVAIMLTDVQQSTKVTARGIIDLSTTTGEHYRLSEQEQQLTVVNFFATWCPPCKAEMPHLQSFAQNLPANVEIIGVNLVERDDGEQALNDFMNKYDVTYPVLLDETDNVGKAFHVISIPTTVLLNSDGQEVKRIVGPVSEHALRKLVEQYK